MTEMVDCPSCGEPEIIKWDTVEERESYSCPRCGDFAMEAAHPEGPLELRRDAAGTVWLMRPDRDGTVKAETPAAAGGIVSEPQSGEAMEALARLDAAIAKLGGNRAHIDLVTAHVVGMVERLRRLREQRVAKT